MRGRSKTDRQTKASGFTLIELLAATTMFVVLVGAIYSVLHGTINLREEAYEKFEKQMPRDYVVGILTRDLANIVPPTGLLASSFIGKKQEAGSVRSDTLEFHSASGILTDQEPWGDIQKIEYSLEVSETSKNSDSRDFVRAVTRNLLASTTEEPITERLLQNVKSFSVTYYDEENWLDSWDSTTQENALPYAIKIVIEFLPDESGAESVPPVTIVAPIATAAASLAASQDSESESESESTDSSASPSDQPTPAGGGAPSPGGGGGAR